MDEFSPIARGTLRCAQSRADRVLLSVNGRPVSNRTLQSAVRAAYKGRLISGEYPQAVLFLELPAEEVDVNVHPAKSEVRLRNEQEVFSAVLHAVQSALAAALPLPPPEAGAAVPSPGPLPGARVARQQGFWGSLDSDSVFAQGKARDREQDCFPPEPLEQEKSVAEDPFASVAAGAGVSSVPAPPLDNGPFTPEAREEFPPAYGSGAETGSRPAAAGSVEAAGLVYLGQVADTFLVARRGNALLLLDQHAVHERIRLHQIQRGGSAGLSQLLALPLELSLHPSEAETLREQWSELGSLGFNLETDGPARLRVTGLPPGLDRKEAEQFLRLAMAGKKGGFDSLWHLMACHTAIKAGQELTADEACALLAQWVDTPDSGYCPHGRPTAVTLTPPELEKLFKRKP
jgi:DNA mismatch repair protein MutL